MKILLISGHGAGDSGAVGCGFKEAELTRTATYILAGKFASYDVTTVRYPTSQNCYEDLRNGKSVNFSQYALVVEVHFNSASASAHGEEVLYRSSKSYNYAKVTSDAIASVGFTNRGAKVRTDLKVMNTCYRAGVPYILIETCFISNKDDMALYSKAIDKVWTRVCEALAKQLGIKKLASNGGDAVGRWVKSGGYWYYYEGDTMVKSKWVKWKGEWYYLKSDGKMAENAWQKDSTGKWCYLGEDGKMVKSTWIKSNGYWYYMKSNGYMADDEWVQYKGGWYYLQSGGKMATGELSVKHKFDASGKCVK